MTGQQKAAIVVLALVAVAMIAGFVAGAGREDEGDPTRTPVADLLASVFPESRPVRRSDVKAPNCFKGSVFVFNAARPCNAIIAKSDERVRSMRLVLAEGLTNQQVKVAFESKGEHGVSMEVTLRPKVSASPTLQVFGEGATLMLTCVAPIDPIRGCQVRLDMRR